MSKSRIKLKPDSPAVNPVLEDNSEELAQRDLEVTCEIFDLSEEELVDPEDSSLSSRKITWIGGNEEDGQIVPKPEPQIRLNQIHAFPASDQKSIGELHVYIDFPDLDLSYTDIMKAVPLVNEGGEIHIHIVDDLGMHMLNSLCLMTLRKLSNARQIFHLSSCHSTTSLAAAMRGDEVRMTEFTRVDLQHSEEQPIGCSRADLQNNMEYTGDQLHRNLDELISKGIITQGEKEAYLESDKALHIDGTRLHQRVKEYLRRQKTEKQNAPQVEESGTDQD